MSSEYRIKGGCTNFSVVRMAMPIFFAAAALAQHAKMSSDLEAVDPHVPVDIIVQFTQPPTNELHQKVVNLGGVFRSELRSINGGSYSLPAASLPILASDPEVTFITPDRKVHGLLDHTAAAVKASAAWDLGLNGSGIGVAVVDSGVSEHEDLTGTKGSRIVFRKSFVGADTTDRYGHGEHVAGIIAGNGAASRCSICNRNLIGIAPNANIIDLQALDATGEGSDSTIIAAIEEAIQLRAQYNIRVINLSLGRPVFESYTKDPLCLAAEAAWRAGIVVVVAAGNYGRDNVMGNNGYGTISAPANDPYVITVGAMKSEDTPDRSDDLVASYSSKGPTLFDHIVKPDIVAPGNRVVSLLAPNGTLARSYPENDVPLNYYEWTKQTTPSPYYFTLSGTSMAAPVVSGAVAVLLQAHPNLTPDQVKARLMRTAYRQFPRTSTAHDPVTGASYLSEYDVFTVGSGYLDIQAALRDTTAFSGSALSPVATYYPKSAKAFLLCPTSSVCGGASRTAFAPDVVWGEDMVAEDGSIWGDQTLWGDASIWGDPSEQTDLGIFGDQTLWGDATTAQSLTNVAIRGEN